jgi:exosortase/archaeosortase family protein
MKKTPPNRLLTTFYRYFLLLVLIILFSYSTLIYNIFISFTIYPVNFILSLFYNSAVSESMIFIENNTIEIIPACVGVSAYLLLLILNLTIRMPLKRRLYSLVFSVFSLLILNILRISLLSSLLIGDFAYFNELHKFLWYFMSIVLVITVWFATAYIFKIKEIPVYSDFKQIIKQIRK